jgi:hypothetical protein
MSTVMAKRITDGRGGAFRQVASSNAALLTAVCALVPLLRHASTRAQILTSVTPLGSWHR